MIKELLEYIQSPLFERRKAVKKRKIGLLKVMSGADEGEQRAGSSAPTSFVPSSLRGMRNERLFDTTERVALLKLG